MKLDSWTPAENDNTIDPEVTGVEDKNEEKQEQGIIPELPVFGTLNMIHHLPYVPATLGRRNIHDSTA